MNIFSTSCNTIRSQQVPMNHQLQTHTDTRQAHLTPALSPSEGGEGEPSPGLAATLSHRMGEGEPSPGLRPPG